MIYAYMNAITQNVTLKEAARHEGRKIQDITFADPSETKNLTNF